MSTVATYPDLKGKNVLVTGGASGLGYSIAQAFVANHAQVLIAGRDKGKLERARKELGGGVRVIDHDLTQIDRIPAFLDGVRSALGSIDVLVNNAGVNLKEDALRVSDAQFQNVILTNQTAVFSLTRDVAKSMIALGTGNIIMISSMATHYGIPKVVAYTASKAAVEGMTRALAVEWSPHGIRVNCIAPGFIATAMSSKAFEDDPERKRRVIARTPMGRLGEPADVANAALFLASNQSKFITGIVLQVDGGNSIGF